MLRLRSRIALIAIVPLLLALAVWLLLHSLGQALRDSHQTAVVERAQSIAADLDLPAGGALSGPALYVHPGEQRFVVDGYAGEWDVWTASSQIFSSADPRLQHQSASVIASEWRGRLHLLVQVETPDLLLTTARSEPGDRLILTALGGGRTGSVTLAPAAPGWFERRGESGWPHVQAALQPTERGWLIELVVLEPVQPEALGLELVLAASDRSAPPHLLSFGSEPAPLQRPLPAVARQLEVGMPAHGRAWVIDANGWTLARAESAPGHFEAPGTAASLWAQLATHLLGAGNGFSAPLEEVAGRLGSAQAASNPRVLWNRDHQSGGLVLSATAAIEREGQTVAHVIVEQPADRPMIDAWSLMAQLVLVSVAGALGIAVLLMLFATGLVRRIDRLRMAGERAVGRDGRVREALPAMSGRDEVAMLGRSLAAQIDRQRKHQEHLQAMASRLSHELRTPLAMIRSSLDNLAEVDQPALQERYRERAQAGCRRLQHSFQAMSQAARIESSLGDEPLERLDLGALVEAYAQSCQETFAGHRFSATVPQARSSWVDGAGELITQMMDKLVENAVDFSPPGSRILLRVAPRGSRIVLQVENPGPPLPDALEERLFDSMVSVRDDDAPVSHLGLGLYVVRLIADHHDARCRAINRSGGVRFEVDFPRAGPA